MGWMEEHQRDPGLVLLEAVDRFLEHGTTGNREKMQEAADRFRQRFDVPAYAPEPGR